MISCRNCESPVVEPGFALPLCAACRDTFVHRPIPRWLVGTVLAVLMLVVFTSVGFPLALKADQAYAHGQQAELTGNYDTAVADYQQVLARYPQANEVKARLGTAQFRSGQFMKAIEVIEQLDGHELPDEAIDELNGVVDEMEELVKQKVIAMLSLRSFLCYVFYSWSDHRAFDFSWCDRP